MYEHHSSLLSSGTELSSSSELDLLLPRAVAAGFVDLFLEAVVVVVLERIELNFDHPS